MEIGVYVSSTWLDLRAERQAVEELLHRFRTTRFVGMEYFGSRDSDPAAASLEDLQRCQVYIGILGRRYGSGITELEYRRARQLGLHCLIYVQEAECRDAAAERLMEEICAEHTVTSFRSAAQLAASVAADLHNWIFNTWAADRFVRSAVDGVDLLAMDYAGRIENFLVEYLGTRDRPVPFGGRGDMMARLDHWLEGEDSTPYALLAASAGRGKSALVARWSRSLIGRPRVDVVFFPVSIRFRTNVASVVFASLAARLARVFGEEIRYSGDMPAEFWRGLLSSYLRRQIPDGRKLVVVIDGLDEAADWAAEADLFPQQPPRGLKALVTARYRAGDADASAWLASLGWERGLGRGMELDPLTREGVGEVVVRMGAPLDQIGTRVDVIGELHRLSEGDPLLVRLYVEDLWLRGEEANRIEVEDLGRIEPGLRGYFERWWREQQSLWGDAAPLRQSTVQSVLNVLACALGPLTVDDIVSVSPPESGINTWSIEDSLRPLNRFVRGDGRRFGFVFSHPRLAIHFFGLLSAPERRRWEQRFLEWGSTTLRDLDSGVLEPADVPAYLVQYYGAHLERAHSECEPLLALLSDRWRRAGLAFEGAYTFFLNDVERVRRRIEACDSDRIARGMAPQFADRLFECALCFASVNSLAANVQPPLLAALLEKGVWTAAQALAYLRRTSDGTARMQGIAAVAKWLPDALLEQAVDVCGGLLPPELLARLAESGNTARALACIEQNAIWYESQRRFTDWIAEISPEEVRARISSAAGIAPWLSPAEAESLLACFGGAAAAPLEVIQTVAARLSSERACAVREQVLRNAIALAEENAIDRIASALDPERAWRVYIEAAKPADEWDRLFSLLAVAGHIPPAHREAAVEYLRHEVREAEQASGRVWDAVARLLPLIAPDAAQDLALRLAGSTDSTEALARAAPFLDPRSLQSILEPGRNDLHRLVPAIAACLEPDHWRGLMQIAMDPERINAQLLDSIASLLPEPVRRDACELAFQDVYDKDDQEALLRALAPVMAAKDIERVYSGHLPLRLDGLLRITQRRAELAASAAGVEQFSLAPVMKWTWRGADPVRIISGVAHYLTPALLLDALEIVQGIYDVEAQDGARHALGRVLISAGCCDEALRIAGEVRGRQRSRIIEGLATELVNVGEHRRAFEAIAETGDEAALARILRACLSGTGGYLFDEALEWVQHRTGQVSSSGNDLRLALVENWPPLRASELPSFVEAIEDPIVRCSAVAMAREEVLAEVAQPLVEIALRENFEYGLARLASGLKGADRNRVITELLARAASHPFGNPVVLNEIASLLPESLWPEAWSIACRTGSSADGIKLRGRLAASAPPERRPSVSESVLEEVLHFEPVSQRRKILTEVAEWLAEPFRSRAWEEAFEAATSGAHRDRMMADVLAVMPDDLLPRVAGHIVNQPRFEESRWVLLTRLGSAEPGGAALASARDWALDLDSVAATSDPYARAVKLADVVHTLRTAEDQEEAVSIARDLPASEAKVRALFALADLDHARVFAIGELVQLAGAGVLSREKLVRLLELTCRAGNPAWNLAAARAVQQAFPSEDIPEMTSLTPVAAVLPPDERYSLFASVLRSAATASRKQLLGRLESLSVWLHVIAGPRSLTEASNAIARVAAWWP